MRSRMASGRASPGSGQPPAVDSPRRKRIWRAVRRNPQVYAILLLMVISTVMGMATGFTLMMRLNYLLILVLIGSYIWAVAGFKGMDARVRRPTGPLSVGDSISEEILVTSRGTPKAWVEVEDKTDIPGLQIRGVASLGVVVSFSRFKASARLTRRGEYTLGPLVVRVSDPFSLFPQEAEFQGPDRLLVYPQIVPVPDFASPSIQLIGDNSRRQRANVISPDVSSVREYRPGDSISRIHWLSTARTRTLMVKQFDRGSASHLWVIFDQERSTFAGEGHESTDEYGATIAASTVDRYFRSFLPVGYAAHGSTSLVMPPDRWAHQREMIMRHIAASKPSGYTPLLDVLADLEREFSQSSSLVVVTSAGDGDWTAALDGLQRRGVKVNVILIDRESFGGPSNAQAAHHLAGLGVRTFRLHRSDSIAAALAAPLATSPGYNGHRAGLIEVEAAS